MSADYPPGTVATATVDGVQGVRVFCQAPGRWAAPDAPTGAPCGELFDIRPLVVLDLADPAAAERHLRESGTRPRGGYVEDIADQIEATQSDLTTPVRVLSEGVTE